MGILDLKTIGKILKEAGKIDQYRQILEIQEKLLEMQKEIVGLEEKNKVLEEKLKIKEELFFENNAYWFIKEDKKDGPFCSCCWDNEKKTVRMQPGGNPAYYSCPKRENKSVKIYPERNNPPRASIYKPLHR